MGTQAGVELEKKKVRLRMLNIRLIWMREVCSEQYLKTKAIKLLFDSFKTGFGCHPTRMANPTCGAIVPEVVDAWIG